MLDPRGKFYKVELMHWFSVQENISDVKSLGFTHNHWFWRISSAVADNMYAVSSR